VAESVSFARSRGATANLLHSAACRARPSPIDALAHPFGAYVHALGPLVSWKLAEDR